MSKFTPKEGLRLKIPSKGILIVDEVCGEAFWPGSPWRCTVRVHWAGHLKGFTVNGQEWLDMTSTATLSRW